MAEAEAIAAFEKWWAEQKNDVGWRPIYRENEREAFMAGWIARAEWSSKVDLTALRVGGE